MQMAGFGLVFRLQVERMKCKTTTLQASPFPTEWFSSDGFVGSCFKSGTGSKVENQHLQLYGEEEVGEKKHEMNEMLHLR